MLKLYNTLSKSIEEFSPLNPPKVTLYTCGPTVYDYTHIGHIRKYVGDDILKKVLIQNGFEVRHVMNITDVGHLVSDEDTGDDKLEKGAKDRNMTVWEVAKFFEDYFFKTMDQVNIERPEIVCRATEHIGEQIKLIQKLEENGFTYITEEAIYFDTAKFENYGSLSGQNLEDKKTGARGDVKVDPKKKNPADFALWFFTVGHFSDHVMRWESPWGMGFPGWHIECSAMSMEYLGNTLDIHTGGIDHIPVHHTNEIAQSEAATGEQFVKFWVHHEFLLVDGTKMSKSLKNFYTIDDIKDKGFDPISLRYLFLTANYRDKLNFTWESLGAAQNALNNLREILSEWDTTNVILGSETTPESSLDSGQARMTNQYSEKFMEALNDNLNTSKALAVFWEVLKSDLKDSEKAATILEMDKVLGLELDKYIGQKIEIPEEVSDLLSKRQTARDDKDFEKSDQLRKEISRLGFEILDTPEGPKVKKN